MTWGKVVALTFLAFVAALPTAQADPKADLDSAVAAIAGTTPGGAAEAAAMERAIAAARAVRPAPAAPDATIAFEGRAEAATRAARDKTEFKSAADEFGKAARIAPWVAAYHYNRGLLLEKAEDYSGAKRSLDLYLKASPNAQDAREVRKKIAGLDYMATRPPPAAPAAAPAVSTPRPAAPKGPTPESLAGLWRHDIVAGWRDIYEMRPAGGNRMVLRFVRSVSDGAYTHYNEISLTANGLAVDGTRTWQRGSPDPVNGTVSSDGRSLILRYRNDPTRSLVLVRHQ